MGNSWAEDLLGQLPRRRRDYVLTPDAAREGFDDSGM
jgi:hypothetical protein